MQEHHEQLEGDGAELGQQLLDGFREPRVTMYIFSVYLSALPTIFTFLNLREFT